MQLAVAAFVCPLEHAMRFGEGTAAEGLDCGVPVPFPSFTRACLCVVVNGDRARYTRQAQQRDRAQMAAFGRVGFSGFSPTLTLIIKKMGTFLGARDLSKSRHPPALHLLSSLRGDAAPFLPPTHPPWAD